MSYPEALGELTKEYFTIAVSGTHGKSTTAAMIALILIKAGLDPTVIIGTKLKEFNNSNFRLGKKTIKIQNTKYPILVIEADEHFASFLHYWPQIIVLTNIEADHLDYYKNLSNIIKAFKEYIGHLPRGGFLVANGDDKNISKIKAKISKLQFKTKNYSLKHSDAKKMRRILKIPGEHNVANALAALAAARALKIPDKVSFKALSEFWGSWRRFEEMQNTKYKIRVINDYGHHPTEVLATLRAGREKYPKEKIWCVFQPHQHQRTHYLFNDFVKAFREAADKSLADKLIITDIYDVAGREERKIKKKVSAEKLVQSANRKKIIYLAKGEVLRYLEENLARKEVLILMGAGDIYKLQEQL